jgi:hypothetical protein
LQGMTYYIFLKSLRSLEEFRKNPHVKILPKSPSTNFQSLGKFKNPIFNSEILLPCFRPGQPCGPHTLQPSRLPLASLLSWAESNPTSPASPRVNGTLAEVRFPFWFTPPRVGRLSLIPLTTGPRLSAPSPTSSRPSSPASPLIHGHRAPPSSTPRVPLSRYHLAFISPPLISLLNPPPSSMALKPLTPALTTPATPPGAPSTPIKGEHHPRVAPHLPPLLFLSLHA